MFQELDVEISLIQIRKAVQSLKNGKSSGPDLWINEFIKYGITNFLEYFYVLFNKMFDTGYFPDSWGDGFIVPIHSKCSALLSVIGKLFTNILNSRLIHGLKNITFMLKRSQDLERACVLLIMFLFCIVCFHIV